MFYIALECLYQLPNEWEETKETNTRHFLGINSRYCSILSKYNMGIREWGVLQKMEKLKIHLSEQEIFAYCKIPQKAVEANIRNDITGINLRKGYRSLI